jgi:glutaminyl-peptide cyclotransferase
MQRRLIWVVLAALLAAGCREPQPPASAARGPAPAAFEGARALEEVRRLVELGPRAAGTPGSERAARHLQNRLTALGVAATLDEFDDATPQGTVRFRNVVGRIPGGAGLIILGSHYDTKAGLGPAFQGANDSGSSTGVLLELARVLRGTGSRDGPELRLVFFDGEECLQEYGPIDGLHGSRHLAQQLVREGRAPDVRAVLVLDMVGDPDLRVTVPAGSDLDLTAAVFAAARAEGVRERFALLRSGMVDDHAPFLEAGMPAIDLIDYQFGSAPGLNDYWHTEADRLDRISPASLQLVGRVTVRVVDGLLAPVGKAPGRAP